MRVKHSVFNNKLILNETVYLYNSLTNSLIKTTKDKSRKIKSEIDSLIESTAVESDNNYLKLGFVVNNNLDESKIVEYRRQKIRYDSNLSILDLFPTFKCNLSCEYCTLQKQVFKKVDDNRDNVKKYYKNILSLLDKIESKKIIINILGGEPLLFADELFCFLDKVKQISSKKIAVGVITNGTLLSQIKYSFNDYSDFVTNIQITFDGTKEFHNSIKNSKNSYEQSVLGVISLLERGYKNNTSLRINISDKNKDHIFEILLSLKKRIKLIDKVTFYPAFINDINNNQKEDNYCVPNEENHIYEKIFFSACKKLNLRFYLSLTPMQTNCSYHREYSLSISPEMKCYKCVHQVEHCSNSIGMLTSAGEIKYNNFFNEARVLHLNNSVDIISNKCRSCSWFPVCNLVCPITDSISNNCKVIMKNKFLNYITFLYEK